MCVQHKSFKNTVGKGEIVRNKEFLHFPQCFPFLWRTFCHFHETLKLWTVNTFSFKESKICRLGNGEDTECIENILGKGEIACFKQFHLFLQCLPKVFFFNVSKLSIYFEERVKVTKS